MSALREVRLSEAEPKEEREKREREEGGPANRYDDAEACSTKKRAITCVQ